MPANPKRERSARIPANQQRPSPSLAERVHGGQGAGNDWKPDGKYCVTWGAYRVTENHTQAGWLYAAIADKAVIGTYATAAEAKAELEGKRK